ncbi:nuclear transport factor 2 family protein [Lentzea sp. NPDC058436]|uniref:nuclear transport factor 2 family protein n=1 Tax=Lentzea sp. NPDC058436 TaxID=3346499 RepID=UPI00365D5C27
MENNEERMQQWCRMWSEDPMLAHELMTPGCVQWSGQTTGLDGVVGPAEQVRFVEGYRAQHVNVFTARVLADGGDRFAYLWDVKKPDGGVVTGFDFNVLHGGKVAENWTFAADWHDSEPDLPYAGGDDLEKVLDDWLSRRGLTVHREPVLDPVRGTIAFLWTGPAASGAELLAVRDGEVARSWSLTGTRPFRY